MYSSSDEEEMVVLFALLDERNRRKRKRQWVHSINLQRQECGEFYTLMPELRKDEKRFYIYYRMSSESFDEILGLIREDITKMDTNYRQAIPAEERLAITLRFLATGDSFITIGHSFRVGFETVSQIVQEVCAAICRRMEHLYLPEPTTEIWEQSAKGYEEVWKFPNCIGSIDGKHATVQCPNKTGSNYFCYLHKFSVVLLVIVGPDYRFICVDFGGYGKNSDGGIFEASNMGERFEAGLMNVPRDKPLTGQEESCPHVLIGDEAFALKPYLMRPFPYRQSRVNRRQENFNNRLCKARRVVENAFGILTQKWRIFFRPISTKVETTILIVKTTCVLHNFLLCKKCDEPFPTTNEEESHSTEQAALINMDINPRRATIRAFNIREKFVSFCNTNI